MSVETVKAVRQPTDAEMDPDLFFDVARLLADGLPEPPKPVALHRRDGHALLYQGKVNVLFGDPESGKTWVALAAVAETLVAGRRAAVLDLDHNGAAEIVARLLLLGAPRASLVDLGRFRLAEPDDRPELMAAVAVLSDWRPAVAVVDSLGELLPMMNLSSNSPDDWTIAHRHVPGALARTGASVVVVDHLPKDDAARAKGQTGTGAKRRTTNGVSLRVTVSQVFVPGRGGAANLMVHKDRPGGVRAHCPTGRPQPAGRFVMEPVADGGLRWWITDPNTIRESTAADQADDVAELDALDPPPTSVRDVKDRTRWGTTRASEALRDWRALRSPDGGTEE